MLKIISLANRVEFVCVFDTFGISQNNRIEKGLRRSLLKRQVHIYGRKTELSLAQIQDDV